MTCLLADVGGTNTRLALSGAAGFQSDRVTRFRNETFADFDTLLAAYLSEAGNPAIDAVCIAVAGPVQGAEARLTNRDWVFRCDRIADIAGTRNVFLINDLTALALALPHMQPEWISGPPPVSRDGQSLVVGMGTGFNVSLARTGPAGDLNVFAAEMGHAGLPVPVLAQLEKGVTDARTRFQTVEDCFSGPGLEQLFLAMTGNTATGSEIMQRFGDTGDTQATRVVSLFASALGVLARELIYHYMPRAGIVFAGSVSVSILGSDARQPFLSAFLPPGRMSPEPETIPVSLVTDDTAALWGCLNRILREV